MLSTKDGEKKKNGPVSPMAPTSFILKSKLLSLAVIKKKGGGFKFLTWVECPNSLASPSIMVPSLTTLPACPALFSSTHHACSDPRAPVCAVPVTWNVFLPPLLCNLAPSWLEYISLKVTISVSPSHIYHLSQSFPHPHISVRMLWATSNKEDPTRNS